jgi:uncharacterized protein GlcG (DUF336 family)
MKIKHCLTLDDARHMAEAARALAKQHDCEPTIAIVDRGGDLIYLERPDEHSANSVEMATGKARTAAFRERPSSALEERVKTRPGFLMTPNQIGVRGGTPIFYKGECVGGFGVSGIGEFDEPVSAAGAEALKG